MPPTKVQIENAINLGAQAVETLVREVQRPGGGALMMDGPALPIYRIIPEAGGGVYGYGTTSITGVSLPKLVVNEPYKLLVPGVPEGGVGGGSEVKVERLDSNLETEGTHKLYWEEYKYTFKYFGSSDSEWQARYEDLVVLPEIPMRISLRRR